MPAEEKVSSVVELVHTAAGAVSHVPHEPPHPLLPQSAVPHWGAHAWQAPFAQPYSQDVEVGV